MRWVLAVAPLFLFALAEIVRSRRRKLILRRVRAPRPPFAWPIRVPTRANPYAHTAELRDVMLPGGTTTDKPGVVVVEGKLKAGEEYFLAVGVRGLFGHVKFTAR